MTKQPYTRPGERIDQCEVHLKELRDKRPRLEEELRKEKMTDAEHRGDLEEHLVLMTSDEFKDFLAKSNNPKLLRVLDAINDMDRKKNADSN